MANRSAKKALKQLRSVTVKALASGQIKHAAEEAMVDGAGKGTIKKTVRRAARTVAADVAKTASKSAKKLAANRAHKTKS